MTFRILKSLNEINLIISDFLILKQQNNLSFKIYHINTHIFTHNICVYVWVMYMTALTHFQIFNT